MALATALKYNIVKVSQRHARWYDPCSSARSDGVVYPEKRLGYMEAEAPSRNEHVLKGREINRATRLRKENGLFWLTH